MTGKPTILVATFAVALACGGDDGGSAATEAATEASSGSGSSSSDMTTQPTTAPGSTSEATESTGADSSTGAGTTTAGSSESTDGSSEESDSGVPGCGNAVVEPPEECDLGSANGVGLGCKDDCTTNTCPDGYVGPGEQCDDDNDEDNDACPTTCLAPLCGDGFLNPGIELCDGTQLDGQSCETLVMGTGTLSCFTNCMFNTSGCEYCGDGVVNGTEACDGAAFDPASDMCSDLGFVSGTVTCNADCTVDTALCTLCGNNVIDAPEVCDGTDLAGDCVSEGFGGGTIACAPACDALDTSGCV